MTVQTYHLAAILIGVVKQEVNKSAGKSGCMGRVWFIRHAPSWIQFLKEDPSGCINNGFWVASCWKLKNIYIKHTHVCKHVYRRDLGFILLPQIKLVCTVLEP